MCADGGKASMELSMTRKLLLTFAGAAAAALISFGAAQAAPASGNFQTLKAMGLEQSVVEEARRRCYRRCWRHRGHWHCRRYCRWRRW
jgi:hypothetical protein